MSDCTTARHLALCARCCTMKNVRIGSAMCDRCENEQAAKDADDNGTMDRGDKESTDG